MKYAKPSNNKETVFQELYESYYASFCLYAKRFMEDPYLREDIVSDVFVTLWDKWDELDLKPETTLAFLKMCVRNSCLNYIKHSLYEFDYAEKHKRKAPLYEQSPDALYNLEELYELLYKSLKKLPENYQHVFVKHFFEGKTQVEVAQEMQVSVKSIKRYKQKILEVLRQDLKDYLPVLLLLIQRSSSGH